MSPNRRLLAVLGLALALACTRDPGPLAPGDSRIKVTCTGLGLDGVWLRVRDPNGTWVGSPESLGCFFYQAVYFDVPVPPLQYQVITGDGSTVIETVTFGGPGEKKTVKIWKIMVGYTVAA